MNSDLSYSELQNEFLVEIELENTNGIKFYLEEMAEINSCTVFIASAVERIKEQVFRGKILTLRFRRKYKAQIQQRN